MANSPLGVQYQQQVASFSRRAAWTGLTANAPANIAAAPPASFMVLPRKPRRDVAFSIFSASRFAFRITVRSPISRKHPKM
jgi:hypothetical protein